MKAEVLSSVSFAEGWRENALRVLAIALLAAFVLINLGGLRLAGSFAWDDGAITLAYSRTLAENGLFALTKVSEVVEGSSSLLMVLVMAALQRILGLDFHGMVLASQIVAFVFLCATLLLLFNALHAILPSRSERLLLVCAFGLLPMFTAEVMNGMEMSLMAFLLAAFYVSFVRRTKWLFALAPLLILVRFEAVFHLLFALALFWLLRKDERKSVLPVAAWVLGCFLAVGALRWFCFHDVLPNTLWAKMNPPYSLPGEPVQRLLGKLAGAREFLDVTGFLLAPALVLRILRGKDSGRSDLGLFLILAFALFAVITGRNMGYEGRMFLASLPLMILAAASSLESMLGAGKPVKLAGFRFAVKRRGILFSAILLCLAGAHLANHRVHRENEKTMLFGAHSQGLIPEAGDRFVVDHLRDFGLAVRPGWFGVTPENYRLTGLAVEKLRLVLGLDKIVFMVPDVGGLGLCCENIRVIDSALLTNSYLARQGYRVFSPYLSKVRPDVIETHENWSKWSRIYDSGYFQANYQPIVFENNLLWIRADRFASVLASALVEKKEIPPSSRLDGVRYLGADLDRQYREGAHIGSLWNVVVKR